MSLFLPSTKTIFQMVSGKFSGVPHLHKVVPRRGMKSFPGTPPPPSKQGLEKEARGWPLEPDMKYRG